MADYITQTDLEHAISKQTVKSLFDEGGNVADPEVLASCIAYATAECNSFLRKVLVANGGSKLALPLSVVPDEVKFAALDFALGYGARRKPDVAKAMGIATWTDFYKAAAERMKRYCEAEQQVAPEVATPGVIGASLQNPDVDEDGNVQDPPDEGRWTNMGGFG